MIFFRFFLIFIFVNSLNAQISLTEEEKEWIANNPILKVGVDRNWPPFDYVDKNNKHKGISSDYLSYISSKTGLNFEIYSNNWINILKKINKKEIDVLACVVETEKRSKNLSFSSPYVSVDVVVVAKKDLKLKNFDEIRNYTLAIPKGNVIHDRLKKRFPKIKLKFVDSNEEALRLISYGKADIYVGNLPLAIKYIEKHFLTNLEVKFKADLETEDLSLAVLKEKEILARIFTKVIDSMPIKLKEKINNKWIFKSKNKKKLKDGLLKLTVEEKKWLISHGKIKISGDIEWPPYSYINEDGIYEGMIPDLVSMITKKTNLDISYINMGNWTETLDAMKNKKIDIIDAVSYSKNRAEFMNFSTKYFAGEIVIIGNKNNDKYVNSLINIKDKKIATVKGYSVIEKIANDYPSLPSLIQTSSPLEGLKELSTSSIDYLIVDIPTFEYYSKAYGLSNLKIVGPTGYTFEYGFGILKDHKELTSIMNKVLYHIPKDEIDEIYRKWIKVDYEEKIDYELIWKIISIALLIIFGSLYWNRKLKTQIEEKRRSTTKTK